jgi:hypothetical protein
MTNIRFRKEKISIQNIGLQRFWIGVVAGLISAISISLFFNHPDPLIEQLKEVRKRLLEDDRYSDFSKDLQVIKDGE